MREAMDDLRAYDEFLLAGKVFNEELIQQWIDIKLEMEYYEEPDRQHPYEMRLSFDI